MAREKRPALSPEYGTPKNVPCQLPHDPLGSTTYPEPSPIPPPITIPAKRKMDSCSDKENTGTSRPTQRAKLTLKLRNQPSTPAQSPTPRLTLKFPREMWNSCAPVAGDKRTTTPTPKRSDRIVDLSNPHHAQLVAAASKCGPEIYDSDVEEEEDLADAQEGSSSSSNTTTPTTTKAHLFRNVVWGAGALSITNDAEFPTAPQFLDFVPGRWELLAGGTAVADQKRKLVVKLTDKSGQKRVFLNAPPRDWNDQAAITALNKRTVQQIRRNTAVRFRAVVTPYVVEERRWILANLNASAKPRGSWKEFVDGFNARFEGRAIAGEGEEEVRPRRTLSSLSKEVERFGAQYYAKGLVPFEK